MPKLTITTRYRTRPGSNVGRYEARGFGMQRSIIGQPFVGPHRAAARALLDAINEKIGGPHNAYTLGQEIDSTDDGQRRKFEVIDRRSSASTHEEN